MAAGYNLFIIPHDVVPGGIIGLAQHVDPRLLLLDTHTEFLVDAFLNGCDELVFGRDA